MNDDKMQLHEEENSAYNSSGPPTNMTDADINSPSPSPSPSHSAEQSRSPSPSSKTRTNPNSITKHTQRALFQGQTNYFTPETPIQIIMGELFTEHDDLLTSTTSYELISIPRKGKFYYATPLPKSFFEVRFVLKFMLEDGRIVGGEEGEGMEVQFTSCDVVGGYALDYEAKCRVVEAAREFVRENRGLLVEGIERDFADV